ncbi:hypothetical protein NDU88_009785 [Pleurodeles waltl]|uniref:Uncharacterized protein n=1 Tax=Pleurodeles waltl TaxID=8319 RepID=A0AAV7QVL8_PLEWA|nr:hypothetical protein NDU88_009785 [Pleurodeles waltl]
MEQFEKELLDYEEEKKVQAVGRGHQRAVLTGGTLEIPRVVNKKAVQSDRLVGRRHQKLVAGNFPRVQDENPRSTLRKKRKPSLRLTVIRPSAVEPSSVTIRQAVGEALYARLKVRAIT